MALFVTDLAFFVADFLVLFVDSVLFADFVLFVDLDLFIFGGYSSLFIDLDDDFIIDFSKSLSPGGGTGAVAGGLVV